MNEATEQLDDDLSPTRSGDQKVPNFTPLNCSKPSSKKHSLRHRPDYEL